MKLLPTLWMSLGLLAAPALLADDDKHDDHDHKGETAEEHAKHADDDHAGHDHSPHHGGIVTLVDETHHELVVSDDGKVSLYAEGLPEGDALKTVTVRLTVLRGTNKLENELARAEDDHHRFEAAEDFTLEAGDKVVAMIQAEDMKLRMVRFEIPDTKQ